MLTQKVTNFLSLTNEDILKVKMEDIQKAQEEIDDLTEAKTKNMKFLEIFKKKKDATEKKNVLDQIIAEDEKNIAKERFNLELETLEHKDLYCERYPFGKCANEPELLYNPNRTPEEILQDIVIGERTCKAIPILGDFGYEDEACPGVRKYIDVEYIDHNGMPATFNSWETRNNDGEWNLRAFTYYSGSGFSLRFDNLYKDLSGKDACSVEDRAAAINFVGNMQQFLESDTVSTYFENRHCQHEMRMNEFRGLAQTAGVELTISQDNNTAQQQHDSVLSRQYHELSGTQKETDNTVPSVEEIQVLMAEWEQMAQDMKELSVFYRNYIESRLDSELKEEWEQYFERRIEMEEDPWLDSEKMNRMLVRPQQHQVLLDLKAGTVGETEDIEGQMAQSIYNTFKPFLRSSSLWAEGHAEYHVGRVTHFITKGKRWYLKNIDFANYNLEIYRTRKARAEAQLDYENAVVALEEEADQVEMPQVKINQKTELVESREFGKTETTHDLIFDMSDHSVAQTKADVAEDAVSLYECSTLDQRKKLWSKRKISLSPDEDRKAKDIYMDVVQKYYADKRAALPKKKRLPKAEKRAEKLAIRDEMAQAKKYFLQLQADVCEPTVKKDRTAGDMVEHEDCLEHLSEYFTNVDFAFDPNMCPM